MTSTSAWRRYDSSDGRTSRSGGVSEHHYTSTTGSNSRGMRVDSTQFGGRERRRSLSPRREIRKNDHGDRDGVKPDHRHEHRPGRSHAAGVHRASWTASGGQSDHHRELRPAPDPSPAQRGRHSASRSSLYHRRARSTSPNPPPRLITASPSPRLYGYQLHLPSSHLVLLLIGPGGKRSAAIRKQAKLIELTFGYLPNTLAPVARLQGEYDTIRNGIDGIRECIFHETQHALHHSATEESGQLRWCALDSQEIWDMGYTKEEHLMLSSRKSGGVVEALAGIDRRHPFAETMITHLPRGAQALVRDSQTPRATTKRKGDSLERDPYRIGRDHVSFPDQTTDHYREVGGASRDAARSLRPLPPRLRSPSHSGRVRSLSTPSSATLIPSPTMSLAPFLTPALPCPASDLPIASSKPDRDSLPAPSDLPVDPQYALAVLRGLSTTERIRLWGSDPLCFPFASRASSPALRDDLISSDQMNSPAHSERYTPEYQSDDADADISTRPESEELPEPDGGSEEGEIHPAHVEEQSGSERRTDVSLKDPPHDNPGQSNDRFARADSVLSFLDYDC